MEGNNKKKFDFIETQLKTLWEGGREGGKSVLDS